MINILIGVVVLKIIFVLALLCARVKTFTTHYCLAGRIYWRFEWSVTNPNKSDTVYTLYSGPISFVMVR